MLSTSTRDSGEFRPAAVLLIVGHDTMILSTRSLVLQSAGYLVKSASSLAESLGMFNDGDFDMVLLCHSVPAQDRDWFTRAIRASGSRIPIYTVGSDSGEVLAGEGVRALSHHPEELIAQLDNVLRMGPRTAAIAGGL